MAVMEDILSAHGNTSSRMVLLLKNAMHRTFDMAIRPYVLLLCAFCGTLGAATLGAPQGRKSYEGYKVLEVIPSDGQAIKFLHDLTLTDDDLYFARKPARVGRAVQFMVPPHRLSTIAQLLKNADIRYTIHLSNVQQILEPLWKDVDARSSLVDAGTNEKRVFDINKFNTLTDIYGWLNTLVGQCRPGLTCEVVSLGNSFDFRPIYAFRISKTGGNRRAYYIDATTQSNDWISTSTALNILNRLATGVTGDPFRLTEEYDWHVVPVVNPDGYEYTFTSDRFWVKNRKPNGACFGTDLSSNFDNEWGTEGVSHSPCNNAFCGTSPASEPETAHIQTELRRLAPRLRAIVSLKAYGNQWTFPWSHTVNHQGAQCFTSSDHTYMLNIANAAADASQAAFGTTWGRGNACVVSGPDSGTMHDYAKNSAGVAYTFSVALRGDDFIISDSEIAPAFTEAWNGLVALSDTITE